MARPLRSLPLLLLFVSVGTVAHAPASGAPRLPPLASPRVHAEAKALFAHRARTGETFPTFKRNAEFEQSGRLPVVVRWLSTPDAAKLERLAQRGFTLERREPIASGAWLATVTEEGLRALEADPDIARVSVDMIRSAPAPLDKALEETGANVAKRAAIAKNGERLDGKGLVIADIDTPLYIHHPALFRADGGAFAWIDVDGDKKLTPGKDGIDLDGNGTIEPAEVLHELRSKAVSRYKKGEVVAEHASFEPDLDYLYLDTNGNGKRDHGEGFAETTPAYGEPLFVFDDANHDKVTQVTERVIQLKTSKVKGLKSGNKAYFRGKSGASALNSFAGDRDPAIASEMGHSTGVAGILVAGQPGISRWSGIAPEADLLLHDTSSGRGTTAAIQWAIDQKANIILTEYAPYIGVSFDGSSEDETLLDAAFAKGIIGVSPAGNLASSKKHRTMTLQPGANAIAFGTNVGATFLSVAMHYRGAERNVSLSLKTPTSTLPIALPDSAPDGVPQPDGTTVYVLTQTTPRGTHERFIHLYGTSNQPKGAYELTATLDAGAPLEVDLYSGDNVSAWGGGLTFTENTPARTICNPSTSDTTISVAAYVLHDEKPYYAEAPVGAVPSYSSRGPLLDGTPGIEVAAPENPISLAPPDESYDGVLWSPFGGTSGAGPHVAAAAALVMQAFPKAKATDVKKRIIEASKPFSGETEDVVGSGKLDIARAVGATIAAGASPKVKLEAVGPAVVGTDATLRVSAEDEDTASLTARWDLDYDGTFDTEWEPLGERPVALGDAAVGAKLGVKVEVRDNQGNIEGATTTIEVVTAAPSTPAPAAAAPDADDSGCLCHGAGTSPGRTSLPAGAALALGAAAVLRARRRSRSS